MFDINFFRHIHQVKKEILSNQHAHTSAEELYQIFETFRSKQPFVFNLESSNHCNMKCIMCPRTTLMTRPIQHMDNALFEKVMSQVRVATAKELELFDAFVQKEYGIFPHEESENAFYFYISSRHLTLHGFGEPLLDKLLPSRIRICQKYAIPTYFSCVPANINLKKLTELMEAGTGVIKFSIDALEDKEQQRIRGKFNNFTVAYEKILKLLEIKEAQGLKTKIVVTLISLEDSPQARLMKQEFLDLWKDKPVYSYIKSQDNRWLYEEDERMENKSHYESQYCEFPWLSMTVMADGSVVPCTQDFDTEMKLGNVAHQSLSEIWNSPRYEAFRKAHLTRGLQNNLKCVTKCDQKLVYEKASPVEPVVDLDQAQMPSMETSR